MGRARQLPARVYLDGVTRAGGIAVLLPPQPVDDGVAARVLAGLDGLIITGGKDVDPAAYGHPPHPATDEPARDRDQWEFALLAAALRDGTPVLGICRGAQLLNVALGAPCTSTCPRSSATTATTRATRSSPHPRSAPPRAAGWRG